VTIPGRGDLSPPHRPHRAGRWLVTAAVLAILVGGGYAAVMWLTGSSSAKSAAPPQPCPAAAQAHGVHPAQVDLVVLNGTARIGLASTAASTLEQRGFQITTVGNTPTLISGVAVVRFPHRLRRDAQLVAAQISGATEHVAHVHSIALELGPDFTGLRSRAKAKAAYRHALAAAGSTPQPTCTPSS